MKHAKLRKEFKRQLSHLLFGLVYAFFFLQGWLPLWLAWAGFAAAVIGGMFLQKKRTFLDRIILFLEREDHLQAFPLRGLICFLLGAALTVSLFEPLPALCGILILSIVDAVGTVVGLQWGKIQIPWSPEKHLEGSVLGVFGAAWICAFFVPLLPALLGALGGAFLDSFKLKIDDNVLIPVVSAGLIQLFT